MTGILEEYGLDVDAAEELSFEVPDGEYDFTVGDMFVRVGSKAQPDKSWLIIEYLLDSGKKHGELFGLPIDASAPTDKEKGVLGRYKSRLKSLGFEEGQLNEIGRDEIVGIEGHFVLLTSKGYQNIRNLTLSDDGENQFTDGTAEVGPGNPVTTFVGEEAPAAPAKKAPAKRASAAKVTPSAEAPTSDDNPFS